MLTSIIDERQVCLSRVAIAVAMSSIRHWAHWY
jgi:hypothetical protein